MSDKCVWRHPDCFAYGMYQHCKALSETTFKQHKDCPFYKTGEQCDQERVNALNHLFEIGRNDLAVKYEVEQRMMERE